MNNQVFYEGSAVAPDGGIINSGTIVHGKLYWSNIIVLISGGTGSLGKQLTKLLLSEYRPKAIRIYSRDEYKQYLMRQEIDDPENKVSYFIGDVRDVDRLHRAMEGVDAVFHTAAMKQVPACEYNPLEAIKTNILGAQNVLNAAIDCGVSKIMNVSSDKGVNPVNLYGATKLCAEKIFTYGYSYAGTKDIRFSSCRYGNVFGSRGSVIPFFVELAKKGKPLPITHKDMTRFWITIEDVAQFIIERMCEMKGREIFVPKMPSMRMIDLAEIIVKVYRPERWIPLVKWYEEIGIRPGEKIHEVLITKEESRYTEEKEKYFILRPITTKTKEETNAYASDTNDWWLTDEEAITMLKKFV